MSWKNEFYDWVLDRGYDYYTRNALSPIIIDNDIYSANVYGRSEYHAKVVINKGKLVTASCTCPYYKKDHEYCKHIAAVMYEIEDSYPEVFDVSKKHKQAFYFKKDPSSYVDMEKITRDLSISEINLNTALKIYENYKDRVDDFCRNEFDEKGEKQFDITFRTNSSPVYLTLNKDKIINFTCYCSECMGYGYSFKNRGRLCTSKTLALIIADNYFKKHNFDTTNRAGYEFMTSLKTNIHSNVEGTKKQTLHIFPVIEFDTAYDECILKIKIGETKGLVLKDYVSFINTYNDQGIVEMSSKTTYDFKLVDFVDEDKQILNYLKDFVEEYESLCEELSERGAYYNKRVSSIQLKKARIDKLFDLLYGRNIEYVYKDFNNKYKNIIKLSIMNNDLPITISGDYENGNFNGVSIDYKYFYYIQGNKYKYIAKENSFSRLLCDNEVVDNLYSAGSNIKIGKNELADFYYDFLPKLKSYPNLVVKDEMDIIDNIPIRPIFKFYLDNIDGVVTINGKVNYKDKEYSLINLDDQNTRDLNREKEACDLIKEYFEFDFDTKEFSITNDDTLYDLLTEGIGRFKKIGEVFSTDRFDRLKSKKKVNFSVGVSIKSDLLNLSLISELSMDELAGVLSSYKQKKKYHRLKSGDFVDMNDSDLNKLLSLKEEMNITDKKFIKGEINLPTYRVLSLNEELNEFTNVDLKRDKKFSEFVDRFEHIDESFYKIPSGLNAKLRPYQVYGFKWLNILYDCGFGGILADEMGLGKTLQIISLLEYRKEMGEKLLSLIVTPASLVYNWYAEFNKFAKDIKVGMLTGSKDERSATLLCRSEFDVLITSYDLLKRDIDLYENICFDVEVIDEAQYIKNQGTGAAKAVKEINSKKHFALTGTPIENRLSELWSIFDYLMNDYLYSYEYFKKRFETKIVNEKDNDTSLLLKKMIGPFVLRRRKIDVLKDLPDKIEKVYYAEFSKLQKEIYDAQIMKISNLVERQDESAFSRNKIAVLAELTKTRQICCDPSLILDNYKGESAKKETCLELIKESIDGDHKMLIFSQFTSMLELLEEKLKENDIKYYKITGATDKKERLELCNKFNSDDVPVFLISLKAGGTGLNLIGADIVIHYDPWWNEAVISQATDRTHRIGQKKTVTVYKLIAKGTIEEKILKLQEEKKNLADEILSGANTSLTSLSKEELLDLLKGE